MTTDQSQSDTKPKQDVREALELQLFDLVELARDTRSDKGGEAKWVHPRGALVKEFAKRLALAQSDAEPKGIDLDDVDRAFDKWAEHRNGHFSWLDAFRAGVEFGLRHTTPPSARNFSDQRIVSWYRDCALASWSDDLSKAEISRVARATIAELQKRIAELEARPVASAGLIEAATLERYARSIAMWCYRENVTDFERLSYIVNHPVTRRYAKRTRAADRSEE